MALRRLLAVAFTAAAIALPQLGASASADYVGPSSAPKFAFGSSSLNNACTTAIAAVTGKRFRVWSVVLNSGEQAGGNAGTFRLQSASGPTSHTPPFRLPQNVTVTNGPAGSMPVFETTVTNSNLQLCNTTASASTVNWQLTYTEFDPAATAKYNETFLSESASVDVTDTEFGVAGEPIEVDCTDGCAGGAGGGDVTLTAIEGDALTWMSERAEASILAGALAVFLLTGVVIRLFPRKKLPL